MLTEIRITGFGVIAEATITLAKGFTVVTGETGAGKTMVVAGLGLLFGGRSDAGRVRAGAGKGIVEGRLRPPSTSDIENALTALGLDLPDDLDDDGTLVVSRTVHENGRSRGHVAGRSAPVGFLAELGEQLVTVHGQSDQLRLLRPAEQRAALDRFGGESLAQILTEYRTTYRHWREVTAELADRVGRARQRAQEAEVLRAGLAEIEAVAPLPDEDLELRAESQRLEHAEGLQAAAEIARQALSGEFGAEDTADVTNLLAVAAKALGEQAEHDSVLNDLNRRTAEVNALVAELAADLASYADSIEADPARLAAVHERRAALASLTRKYADDIAGVLQWAQQASEKLVELETSQELLDDLTAQRDQLHRDVATQAGQLSAARSAAAKEFSAAVSAELAGLAMPHTTVMARISRQPAIADQPSVELDAERWLVGPDGFDEVELCLAHPGSAPLPIHKGASGGELSRVMLAIEVVFAGVSGPGTMIFDEVDAGVGGKAAVEIGRRLSRLATSHQVLVVTHLPQVAAFADRHLLVEKNHDGSVTTSGVHEVTGAERVKELARMLAGLEDSDLGLAHAQELLELAQAERPAVQPRPRSAKQRAKS